MLARSGDLFLGFIGKKLSVGIAYKNRTGFVSCFILKSMPLESPVFILRDFDLALGCQKARIEPSFGDIIEKRAITLNCFLKNASFLSVEEKIRASTEKIVLFDRDLSNLLGELGSILYTDVYVTLFVYEDRVEFVSYEADSADVLIRASGVITKNGELDINAKAFFSPGIMSRLPEELSSILTEESGGWRSYSLHVEKGEKNPFLKLDSDRFSFNFERVEAK